MEEDEKITTLDEAVDHTLKVNDYIVQDNLKYKTNYRRDINYLSGWALSTALAAGLKSDLDEVGKLITKRINRLRKAKCPKT